MCFLLDLSDDNLRIKVSGGSFDSVDIPHEDGMLEFDIRSILVLELLGVKGSDACPDFVVHKEHFKQNLRTVALGWSPQLFVFEHEPSFIVVPDPQQRDGYFPKKFVLVVFVFIIDSELKNVMDVFDIAVKKLVIRH